MALGFINEFTPLLNLIMLFLFSVSAFGFGKLILQLIGYCNRQELEFYIYAVSLGLGVIAHLVLLAGMIGILTKIAIWVILCLGLISTVVDFIVNRTIYPVIINLKSLHIGLFSKILILILFVSLAFIMVSNTLIPPLDWDALAYHLALPKIFIQDKAISYVSFIPYANWPLETEMLFTFGLLLASENLAQMVTWLCLVLILGMGKNISALKLVY
jgi:hypothetical protein